MSADIEIWNAGASQAFGQAARDRAPDRRERHDLGLERRGAGRRVRGRGGCALHVLGDDAPLGTGSGQAGELDAALAGDPARERRGLDSAVGGSSFLRFGLRLVGGRLSSLLSLLLARGPGRALLLRVLVHLLRVLFLRLDGLTLLADDRDPLADCDLRTLLGENLEERPARLGLDLLGHLVGVELVERLALLDRVALGLQPADDRPGLHALAEPREADLNCHCAPPCA